MVANSLGSDKRLVMDVSSRGSVRSGNCPVWEVSVRDVSVGDVSVRDISVGDVSGKHYAYFDIDVNKSRYTLLNL